MASDKSEEALDNYFIDLDLPRAIATINSYEEYKRKIQAQQEEQQRADREREIERERIDREKDSLKPRRRRYAMRKGRELEKRKG